MRVALSEGMEVEFVIEEEDNSGTSPHITQLDNGEACIVLSNFSGTLRVRRAAIVPQQNNTNETQQEQEQIPSSVPLHHQEDAILPESYYHPQSTVENRVYEPYAPLPSQMPSIHGGLESSTTSKTTEDSAPESALAFSESKTPPPITDGNNDSRVQGGLAKRLSLRVMAQLSSIDDAGGRTALHRLCASQSLLNVRRLLELVQHHPDMVRQQDDNGQLPLHVLGNNPDLLNYHEGQQAARKCALSMMNAYPNAIVTRDVEGRMPFTYLILKWVEWTFQQDSVNTKAAAAKDPRSSIATAVSHFSARISERRTKSRQEEDSRSKLECLQDSLTRSNNRFPPVMIFDEVEFCFEMLSVAMDRLGGNHLDPSKKVQPRLSYRQQRDEREALALNVADIPMLLKTVLLLESKRSQTLIIESSVIRRMLLCQKCVGPWLTSMIRYKKGASSEVAVGFLTTLSKLSVEDFVGDYRKALPHDEKLFEQAKLDVFEAVEELEDMIPSLLVAGEEMLDRAVSTPLIWFVMNRRIATPFTMSLGTTDFKLHLVAMIAFRQVALDNATEREFQLFPWMTVNSVIFWICVHHIVRRICETVALARISRKNASAYLFDPW